jgi:hypothetical protein
MRAVEPKPAAGPFSPSLMKIMEPTVRGSSTVASYSRVRYGGPVYDQGS